MSTSPLTMLSANAIAAHVTMVGAAKQAQESDNAWDIAFRASAQATWLATKGGMKNDTLAKRIKSATAKLNAPKGTAYTSGTSVEYHARAGQLLSLPNVGDSPVKIDARAVQAKIKSAQGVVTVPIVRACIDRAVSQSDALARIADAVAAKQADNESAANDAALALAEAVEAVSDEPVNAPTIADAVRLAAQAVADLIESGAKIDADALDALSMLAALLQPVPATV